MNGGWTISFGIQRRRSLVANGEVVSCMPSTLHYKVLAHKQRLCLRTGPPRLIGGYLAVAFLAAAATAVHAVPQRASSPLRGSAAIPGSLFAFVLRPRPDSQEGHASRSECLQPPTVFVEFSSILRNIHPARPDL